MTQVPDIPEPKPIALRPGDLVCLRDPESLEVLELNPEVCSVVVDVGSQSLGVVTVLLPRGVTHVNTRLLRIPPSESASTVDQGAGV